MAVERFPPVELADEYGLLCVGGDLEVETLLLAYQSGIFPWPIPFERRIPWFSPPQRALLFQEELLLSRSLKKDLRRTNFEVRFNTCFDGVIEGCAQAKRPNQPGTWIEPKMIQAYKNLHAARFAQSVEVFLSGELVGGLYGVCINGMFAGESMFHRVSNASKAALVSLMARLREYHVPWIDCQMLTPTLESFGAREISREEFSELLQVQLQMPSFWFE